jgi:hypothetical protein
MKIVSRLNKADPDLRRLGRIIAVLTEGEVQPSMELQDLVTQVDLICVALLDALDHLENKCQRLNAENLQLATNLAEQEEVLKVLEQGVLYDEDLDHSTTDLMDAFLASGAAESTFDGEISFQPGIVFNREDLKPLVRETVESWLRLKIR